MVWTLPVQQRPPKPKPGEVRAQPVRESPEWQRYVAEDEWPLVLDAERARSESADQREPVWRYVAAAVVAVATAWVLALPWLLWWAR